MEGPLGTSSALASIAPRSPGDRSGARARATSPGLGQVASPWSVTAAVHSHATERANTRSVSHTRGRFCSRRPTSGRPTPDSFRVRACLHAHSPVGASRGARVLELLRYPHAHHRYGAQDGDNSLRRRPQRRLPHPRRQKQSARSARVSPLRIQPGLRAAVPSRVLSTSAAPFLTMTATTSRLSCLCPCSRLVGSFDANLRYPTSDRECIFLERRFQPSPDVVAVCGETLCACLPQLAI